VYRARDHLAGRDVAVKIIPNDVEIDRLYRGTIGRSRSSARSRTSILSSSHGFGETEEVVFLVMRPWTAARYAQN
jgi:hypothetical protein